MAKSSSKKNSNSEAQETGAAVNKEVEEAAQETGAAVNKEVEEAAQESAPNTPAPSSDKKAAAVYQLSETKRRIDS